MEQKLLIVDDDARIRESLTRVLARDGVIVEAAASAEAALNVVAGAQPDIVLTDVRMPGLDGLELLRLLKERTRDADVILMTAYDDLETVAIGMREGAADFLVKPLDLHQLRGIVDRILEDRRARSVADGGTAPAAAAPEAPELIGRDPCIIDVFKVVGQLAANRATVLLRGESGTGKELIARAIHANSAQASEPFVAVNCTALPATLLESELFGHVRGGFTGATADRAGRFATADRGTIFLDEIGDTAPEFQAKLLRVLQEGEYYPVGADRPARTHARVIAATHRDLEQLVEAGSFRGDLYYRLRVVEVRVPPLRERMSDVPVLAAHLVQRASAAARRAPPLIAPEAMQHLLEHTWPGNVRELENCLTRAVVLATSGVIRPAHLALRRDDHWHTESTSPLRSLDDVEAEHVARVLRYTNGNRTRAAEILGVSRPRLRRLLEKYERDS